MKFGCSISTLVNSANLLCRNMDSSKCFIGSLRLQENESRLYIIGFNYPPVWFSISITKGNNLNSYLPLWRMWVILNQVHSSGKEFASLGKEFAPREENAFFF